VKTLSMSTVSWFDLVRARGRVGRRRPAGEGQLEQVRRTLLATTGRRPGLPCRCDDPEVSFAPPARPVSAIRGAPGHRAQRVVCPCMYCFQVSSSNALYCVPTTTTTQPAMYTFRCISFFLFVCVFYTKKGPFFKEFDNRGLGELRIFTIYFFHNFLKISLRSKLFMTQKVYILSRCGYRKLRVG
jgi:hypothetical protein